MFETKGDTAEFETKSNVISIATSELQSGSLILSRRAPSEEAGVEVAKLVTAVRVDPAARSSLYSGSLQITSASDFKKSV